MPSSRARRAAARRAAAARRRRFLAVGAVGLALVVAVLVLSTRREDGSAGDVRPAPNEVREGSEPLAGRSGRLRIRDEPITYRLAYRVETYTGADRVVTRDEITVRRPFEGRTRKLAGAEAGSEPRSEQVGVLGRLFVPKAPSAEAALLETAPSIAPSDLRIGPVLGDLLDADRAEAREWREVEGHPCQIIRFGGPVSAGTVAERLDPDVEYADACISERGIVLEELWVVEGLVQRRRLATEVELDREVAASTFAAASAPDVDPLPVEKGGGSFRPVDPTSAYAAPFWVTERPPVGAYRGRWAIVPPNADDPNDEESGDRRIGAVVDVWEDGVDVVIVEQGSTAGGVRPFQIGRGAPLSVEGLGDGEILLDLRTSEVRFRRPNGYFVRVRGTLGAAGLESVARSLRQTDGGTGLVYLDNASRDGRADGES